MDCIAKAIIEQSCAEIEFSAGNVQRVFATNKSALTAFTTASGAINALTFKSGRGLVPLWGRKEGVQSTSTTVGGEIGAAKVQEQTVIINFKKLGIEFREAVNELLASDDIVLVVQDNADQFHVFGIYDLLDTSLLKSKGMTATYDTDSGVAFTDVVGQTVTFVGQSKYYAGILFFSTDYAATLALLSGYVVSPSASPSASV